MEIMQILAVCVLRYGDSEYCIYGSGDVIRDKDVVGTKGDILTARHSFYVGLMVFYLEQSHYADCHSIGWSLIKSRP